MIKLKVFSTSLLISSISLLGSISKEVQPEIPGHKLEINQELYFTDTNGVATPAQIARAAVGKLVRIYRPDGFCYVGKITEIEEEEGVLKIYGEIHNIAGGRFGFGMAKGGKFAGAVIDKVNDIVYVLDFSEAHKGFVLKRAYKFDKITS